MEQLTKIYGSTPVVNDISFSVFEGEIFGLLGPNGAGKTTTMEMMEGLRKPDKGQIFIDGLDFWRDSAKIKEIIGVQLQSTSLFELLKVKEILSLFASFYQKREPVDQLLKELILEEKKENLVKELSGGQKQRLAIATALVNQPKVIFLDEPTTGLDPQARRGLWDIIQKLREQGKTILLSTHYMEEADHLCDRIAIMDQGRIIALDTPGNLKKRIGFSGTIHFRTPKTDLESQNWYLDQVELVQKNGDEVILFSRDIHQTLKNLFHIIDQGVIIHDLQSHSVTLEDVFLQLTGRRLRD
ncbi:ABC transporter ATP-binding protein [Microaerobacter geothermalis]|uniref:ABC transporter ATP-binding protein n=1 Tax=Microaerobacter geothermalis TaxID=674972 RepID=UPI002E338333|nr:ABC transporter ATP-binding protein [Microaerobacter geothermalis]